MKLLRYFETIRPSDVADILGGGRGNSTGKKRALLEKLRQAWLILNHFGLEAWVLPDDTTTTEKVMAIINEKKISVHPKCTEIVLTFKGDIPEKEAVKIAGMFEYDVLTITKEQERCSLKLMVNQKTVIL